MLIQGRLFKGEGPPHFGLFTLTLETRVYLIMLNTQTKSAEIPPATLPLYIPLPICPKHTNGFCLLNFIWDSSYSTKEIKV